MITKNKAGQWVCHCGQPARNDGSEYDWVCAQWPFCEVNKPEQPE
jgi:hypothetical protein